MKKNQTIEINLESIDHLFEPKLVNPMKQRELYGSGMDILYTRARTRPGKEAPTVVLNLPPGSYLLADIEAAIHKYCDLKIEQVRLEHQILKGERYFGLITGFFVMTLCLGVSYVLIIKAGYPEFIKFYLKEGLFIVGWVSMWRPTEILIFDWWPYRKLIKTYAYIKTLRFVIREQK